MKLTILLARAGHTSASLFRIISEHPDIDLMVYYFSDLGIGKSEKDPQFGININLGTKMLTGFNHKFLKNISPSFFSHNYGLWLNPGIVSEIVKNKYDAVIVFGWNSLTSWLTFITCFITNKSVLLYGENPLNQELNKKRFLHGIKRFILKILFKKISAFLYMGEENRKFYKFFGVPDKKLFFVPYAMDNKRCQQDFDKLKNDKEKIKKDLGIDPENPVVLFVGKLTNKKRPLDLLRAFHQIGENAELVFVGEGHLRPEMEEYIKKNKLSNVHLEGYIPKEDISKYYVAADIFVLPSGMGETWGLVVNEAMNFKLPVIVSETIGSSSDLVHNRENGFKFRLGDIDRLNQHISYLVSHKEERLQMGEESFNLIKKYSHEEDLVGIVKALKYLNIL